MTVGGDFITSGNTSLNLNNTTVARKYNIGGNFNAGGNYFFSNGSGLTTLNFNGSGKTITAITTNFLDFSLGPTVSNVEFHITNGATYTLNSGLSIPGTYNDFIIDNGGTLYTGTYIFNNNRNGESASGGIFTNSLGGTLGIGSAQGISIAGSATGNIETDTRNYNTGANYIYNGATAQITGNGLTQNVPANITINNPGNTVTLIANTNMSGILTVKAASILALLAYNLGSTTAPSALVMEDGAVTGSSITGTGTLTLGGDVTVNNVATGTNGASISAPVSLGTATRTFNVADNGTSAIDLTISSVISSASFGLTKAGAGTMLLSGYNTYTGVTTVNAGTIKLGSTGSASNTPLGTPANGTIVNSGGALDLNGFTLATSEVLTLNGTGTTIEGALTNSSATAVNYTGAITLGSASSIGTTGNITIGNGITGSQDLTKVGAATLNLGAANSTLKGLTISAGTLISTSTNLNLAGNFTNNSIFTNNNGTVIFNGSSAQAILGNSSVFNKFTMNNTFPAIALTLNITTTVNGVLTLHDGHIITTATNILILGTAANNVTLNAAVQDSSFVKGPMIQTYNSTSSVTKVFPIGSDNIMHQANLTVAQKNATATQYTGTFFHASATALGYNLPSTLTKVSDIDYWNIDNGSATNIITANIQLYYFPMDVVTEPTFLRVAKSNGLGNWLDMGGAGTTMTTGNITSNC